MDNVTPQQAEQAVSKKLFSPKLLIPALVIVVVFGALYFFVIAKNKTTTVPEQTQNTQAEEAPKKLDALIALINDEAGSGQKGVAAVSDEGGKAKVVVDVVNFPGNPQPAHIHSGKCPQVGEIKYPLQNLVNGKSETTLTVSVAELRGMFPLSVNVHRSASDSASVACGQISG